LVSVPVTVKSGHGELVPDLEKSDFRIFQDNVEQRIAFFTNEAAPLSIVVLVDNDLKGNVAQRVEGSIQTVVAGMSPIDEAIFCRYDQFFHEGKGFLSDQDRLITEIERTPLDSRSSVGPTGGPFVSSPSINGHSSIGDQPNIAAATAEIKAQSTTALDDAVYSAAELLRDRGLDRRKMILLVSDGQNGVRANKHSYDDTVRQLQRNNVTVYSVAVGAYLDRKFSRLINYAHATGGDVYFAAKEESMADIYPRITEESRHQYTLAYSPTGVPKGEEYHTIEVRVERPGLKVVAREGYYSGVPR
jgi:VWFA-related protein